MVNFLKQTGLNLWNGFHREWQWSRLLCFRGNWTFRLSDPFKAIVLFIPFYLLYLFAQQFDYFELSKRSQQASYALYSFWNAPFYDSETTNDISVVLLSDYDLRQFNEPWPASYDFHADVLDTIFTHSPKAVMVNFAFIDPRRNDDVSSLREIINKYKSREDPVPLYFAAVDLKNKGEEDGLKNGLLASLDVNGQPTPVSVPGSGERRHGFLYCLFNYKSEERSNYCDPWPSAAWAMHAQTESAQAGIAPANPASPPEYRDKLFVTWGIPKGMKTNGPYQCNESLPKSAIGRLFDPFVIFPNWFLNNDNREWRNTCPLHQTVTVSYLFGRRPAKSSSGDNNIKIDCELDQLIRDKYVFYGANLDAVSDYVKPPTHVALPGVYFHAMALDNLLHYKTNYVQENKIVKFGIDIKYSWIMEIFTLIFLFALSNLQTGLFNGFGEQVYDGSEDHPLLRNVLRIKIRALVFWLLINAAVLFAGILFIAAITWFTFSYLKIPPGDFIGMLALVSIKQLPSFLNQVNTIVSTHQNSS